MRLLCLDRCDFKILSKYTFNIIVPILYLFHNYVFLFLYVFKNNFSLSKCKH